MFWSCIICMLTMSTKILIVFELATMVEQRPRWQNIYSSDIILYRNMAATNAMIFSLDCILYSKLPRSLYKPLFHILYWLDGCCMGRGCDMFGGANTLRIQNKKTWKTLRLLETSKTGVESLVFDINYLLSKRCCDLLSFVCSPFRRKF